MVRKQQSLRSHDESAPSYVRRARTLRGLTQGELARRCGLHKSALSRIEGGKRDLALAEAMRLADVLRLPLEWFTTGMERPGSALADIAAELRHLGMVDLRVARERVPGAYRPSEEVLALAIGAERPDPRVIEGLPAVLAWNRWRPGIVEAFARATHPKALTRLGWLAEVTLLLQRTGGFPGGMISNDDLAAFLLRVERPHEQDTLGWPVGPEPEHRVWKYWRINHEAELEGFRARAQQLHSLRSRPDA